MELKAGLIFACMNLKKLAKIKAKWVLLEDGALLKFTILYAIMFIKEKWLWDLHPRAALSTGIKSLIGRLFMPSNPSFGRLTS